MREILALSMIAGLASPGAAHAGQPISESLVDCATLVTLSNRAFPDRLNTSKGRALDRAGRRLLDAARDQARAEGRADVRAHVAALAIAKAETWDAKGTAYVFTQDFRDWMSYCRSLSNHMDIALRD